MTDSKDYRLLLEKEFANLHKTLDEHGRKLDEITIQTTRTNGSLASAVKEIDTLKNQRDKYLETRVSIDMLEELGIEVKDIDKKLEDNIIWGHHIVDTRGTDCPNAKLIHDINNELGEIRIIRKYPKLALILLTIFIVATIISAIGTFESIANKKILNKVEYKYISPVTNDTIK
jgi:hypothetical protein